MVLTGQSAFSYKKKNCQSLCFQLLLFKKCACFDSFLECPICGLPKENVDICKNQDQLDCLDSFSDEENYLLCDKMCPQECEFQNFEKDALTNSIVDFTKFLNVQSNLVNLVANVDNVESIALSLKIYFDDFSSDQRPGSGILEPNELADWFVSNEIKSSISSGRICTWK